MHSIVYISLHFFRVGRSSITVLRPTHKILVVLSWLHCLEHFASEQMEQAGVRGYHHPRTVPQVL